MGYKEGQIIKIDDKFYVIVNGKPSPIEFKDPKKFNIDNLSNKEWFYAEKIRLRDTHKEAASEDAMVVGCYIFLEIYEFEPEHPADNPKRFMAKVMYKSKPEKGYYDSQDDPFETIVRINPLLNSVSTGNIMEVATSRGGWYSKNLKTFNQTLLNSEIHLMNIDLVPSPRVGEKSYAYHWDLIGVVG